MRRQRTIAFLSTPSARRATYKRSHILSKRQFLSTPSARRATDLRESRCNRGRNFYPRPPRGGRPALGIREPDRLPISIHALREEGDLHWHIGHNLTRQFLSTPSARRATSFCWSTRRTTTNFYPRPPRGGRPNGFPVDNNAFLFLSTPSARRATRAPHRGADAAPISIHALREEGDADLLDKWDISIQFLSTPSARRATKVGSVVTTRTGISIHALREEGDVC